MTDVARTCPSRETLADFGLGKLDDTGIDTVHQHLESCADCRAVVAGLSGDSFLDRLRQVQEPAPAAGLPKLPQRRSGTFIAGESLSNAAPNSETPSLPAAPRRPMAKPLPAEKAVDHVPSELADHPDYEVLRELGRGGMGIVYLARNRLMDRLEVLKVVSRSLLEHPGALERFQQEIRSAARLQHPNIVAAYSVLRPGDLLVFCMEYVEGQDLSQVVKQRGPLPVTNATFYAQQVALGLQHAFEKGMVHRDIKPNNLMLAVVNKKHVVKILDFGLAKASSEKGDARGLTKSGQMLGTPDYVAPEQTLNAQHADIRADIYSLGCTLYYLLAGEPPFNGNSLYEILHAHHHTEARALNLVRPEIPLELAAVVATMMAKDPAKRYQSPAEVAKALGPFFKAGTQPTPKPDQSLPPMPATPGVAQPTMPRPIAVAQPVPVATSALENLAGIETAGTSSSQPRKKRHAGRRRVGLPVAIGLLLAGLAVSSAVVFKFRTADGIVALEVNEPNAEVFVDGNQATVTWNSGGTKAEISLPPGSRKIELKKDGFTATGETVELESGGRSILVARLDPAATPGNVENVAVDVSRNNAASAVALSAADLIRNPQAPDLSEAEKLLDFDFDKLPPPLSLSSWSKGHVEDGKLILVRDRPRATSSGVCAELGQFKPLCCAYEVRGRFVGDAPSDEWGLAIGQAAGHFVVSRKGSYVQLYYGSRTSVPKDVWRPSGEFDKLLLIVHDRTAFAYLNGVKVVGPVELPDRQCEVMTYDASLQTSGGSDDRLEIDHLASWRLANEVELAPGARERITRSLYVVSFSPGTLHYPAVATEPDGLLVVWKYRGENPTGVATLDGKSVSYTVLATNDDAMWLRLDKPPVDRSPIADLTTNRQPQIAWRFGLALGDPQRVVVDQQRISGRTHSQIDRWVLTGFPSAASSPAFNQRGELLGIITSASPSRVLQPIGSVPAVAGATASPSSPGSAPMAGAPPLAIAPFDAKQAREHQEAWATHLGTTVETTNSIGMKLVLLPPGEYQMGSTDAEIDQALAMATKHGLTSRNYGDPRLTERPQHRVTIAKPIWMGAVEVTNADFKRFVDDTGLVTEADGEQNAKPGKLPGTWTAPGYDFANELPVTCITWGVAAQFCNWLSSQHQRTAQYAVGPDGDWRNIPGANGYRLPKETEWEYACRAGTTSHFSFGDDPNSLSEFAWYFANSRSGPHPVGSKLPNPFELFDMQGNASEWLHDTFQQYGAAVDVNDQEGPLGGTRAMARGASWLTGSPYYFRSAYRYRHPGTISSDYTIGFRVVCEVDAVATAAPTSPLASSQTTINAPAPAVPAMPPPAPAPLGMSPANVTIAAGEAAPQDLDPAVLEKIRQSLYLVHRTDGWRQTAVATAPVGWLALYSNPTLPEIEKVTDLSGEHVLKYSEVRKIGKYLWVKLAAPPPQMCVVADLASNMQAQPYWRVGHSGAVPPNEVRVAQFAVTGERYQDRVRTTRPNSRNLDVSPVFNARGEFLGIEGNLNVQSVLNPPDAVPEGVTVAPPAGAVAAATVTSSPKPNPPASSKPAPRYAQLRDRNAPEFEIAAYLELDDKPATAKNAKPDLSLVGLRLPYVYALARASTGSADLHVFELPKVEGDKSTFERLTPLATVADAGDGNALFIRNDQLFCTRAGSLEVFSLADPARPQHSQTVKSTNPNESFSALTLGNIVYVVGSAEASAFDLSRSGAPKFVATHPVGQKTRGGIGVGTYLYLFEPDTAGTANGMWICNAEQFDGLLKMTKFPFSGPVYQALSLRANRIALVGKNYAQLYNVGDPAQPVPVGRPASVGLDGRGATCYLGLDTPRIIVNGSVWAIDSADNLRKVATFPEGRTVGDGVHAGASQDDYVVVPAGQFGTVLRALPKSSPAKKNAPVAGNLTPQALLEKARAAMVVVRYEVGVPLSGIATEPNGLFVVLNMSGRDLKSVSDLNGKPLKFSNERKAGAFTWFEVDDPGFTRCKIADFERAAKQQPAFEVELGQANSRDLNLDPGKILGERYLSGITADFVAGWSSAVFGLDGELLGWSTRVGSAGQPGRIVLIPVSPPPAAAKN